MTTKAIVVGAGIAGLSAAVRLSEEGHEVMVLEQGPGPGWNATGRAAGIITRQLLLRHDKELVDYTLRFLASSYEWLVEERTSVTLYNRNAGSADCMARLAQRWRAMGVEYRVAGEAELAGILAGYRIVEGDVGLVTRGDAQVDVGSLSAAMSGDVERLGGEVFYNTVVYGYRTLGDTVVVETSRGPFEADMLLVAAGPWNPRIIGGLRGRVHVYRCQLQSLSLPPPGEDLVVFASDEGFYHAPEASGRSLVGDGCEFLGEPEEGLQPSIEMMARLGERVEKRVPGASEAGLEAVWSAACDVGMDGLPYAGPVERGGRVWVIGGFDGYGVMRAPAVASMVVEAIVGRDVLPGWLSVERLFRYRSPGRPVVLELHSPLCGELPECS